MTITLLFHLPPLKIFTEGGIKVFKFTQMTASLTDYVLFLNCTMFVSVKTLNATNL